MPINMNDPRVQAEKAPQAIVDLGTRLKRAYGVGPDAFGVKGNEYHASGFHRSRNWIYFSPDSAYGTRDYSVQGTRNHGGDPDNDCAFDFTPGTWGTADNRAKMIVLTKRLRAAARRHDPRLANWFEFAGTEDGVNVVTFYAQGGEAKTPFDKSHLDHIHGSKYRDNAEANDTGLGDIMLGLDEEEDMSGSFGPVLMRKEDDEFPMVIPPVQAGVADPRETWINIGGDLGLPAYLRIWVNKGSGGFRPLAGTGVIKVVAGEAISVKLEQGDRIISVSRDKGPNTDVVRAPISFCFERK